MLKRVGFKFFFFFFLRLFFHGFLIFGWVCFV